MFVWYGVVVVILSCIVLSTYSSNNCIYNIVTINCVGNLDNIPTLSETLTDYRVVCIYLGINNFNCIKD